MSEELKAIRAIYAEWQARMSKLHISETVPEMARLCRYIPTLLSALTAAEARAEAAEARLAESLLNPDPWREKAAEWLRSYPAAKAHAEGAMENLKARLPPGTRVESTGGDEEIAHQVLCRLADTLTSSPTSAN